jgi:hypothetical protein
MYMDHITGFGYPPGVGITDLIGGDHGDLFIIIITTRIGDLTEGITPSATPIG